MIQSSKRNSNSLRFLYIFNMLPIVSMLVYYYTHFLEGTYSFVIPLGLMTVWFFLSVLTKNVQGLLFNKVSIWWFAYLFLCIFMVLAGFSSTNLNYVISRLPIYLIPALGYFVIRHYNRKEKIILLTAFFVIYFANLVYNIFLGIQIPGIFEELESTEESIEFGIMMNIASTSFIVVGYWLIGVLLIGTLVIRQKKWKTICLLFVAPIAYYMLFQNTRGTAILLLMAEIVGLFLAYNEPKNIGNRRLYYVFSIAMLAIVTLILFIPLMSWILENIQSERLADRFNDLLDFGKSGGDTSKVSEGSFAQRMLLAQTSLNTFLSSPLSILIGIGDHSQAFGGDLIKSGIGNHSEFIDVLARYGIVGAFVFYKIMRSYYAMLSELTTKRMLLKYVNVIYVIFLLSGFFNNIFLYTMLLFLFLVCPIMVELLCSKINYSNGK